MVQSSPTIGDFGDGQTGTGVNPTHSYASGGSYQVSLTVTHNGATNTSSQAVVVADPPPNVGPNASFDATAGVLTATFDASGSSDSDGSVASYDWDFGDGQTGTGVNPTHGYANSGLYSVTLTVTDDEGATDSKTKEILVLAANSPFVLDDFSRIVSNGWGSAEQGGVWTEVRAPSDFEVAGGKGVLTVPKAGHKRTITLNEVAADSTDTTVDIAMERPENHSAFVSVLGRQVSNNNDYRVKLRVYEDGKVVAALVRMVDGNETLIRNRVVSGLTYNSGDVLRVRLQVSGSGTTDLQAKVWKALDGEPADWTVSGSDSTASLQADGGVRRSGLPR